MSTPEPICVIKSRKNAQGKEELYDPLRRLWVRATPEERVRQSLILSMVCHWGYSFALLSSEVSSQSLYALLGLPPQHHFQRRIDLVYFHKTIEGNLLPLILIECKAVRISQGVFDQVIGYHRHWQCPLLSVVNEQEIYTGYSNSELGGYDFFRGFPTYKQLSAYVPNL
jgi:hypothetical protein